MVVAVAGTIWIFAGSPVHPLYDFIAIVETGEVFSSLVETYNAKHLKLWNSSKLSNCLCCPP